MALADSDPMPFGKHKGTPMEEVPASYLLWLWNEDIHHPEVRAYIEGAMAALEKECPDVIVKQPHLRPTMHRKGASR